jgi:hypothetical protein
MFAKSAICRASPFFLFVDLGQLSRFPFSFFGSRSVEVVSLLSFFCPTSADLVAVGGGDKSDA